MATRGREASIESHKRHAFDDLISEPLRSDTLSLSDELSRSANTIKWPLAPEIGDLEKMTGISTIADFYCLEDLMDTSASERAQLYTVPSEERPGWHRATRNISDSRASPADPPTDKQASGKS